MITSTELGNISKALIDSQKEIKGITKNAQGHGYKYITLDAILTIIKPILLKNGIFLIQNIEGNLTDNVNLAICETRLQHNSGEWVQSGQLAIKPVNPKDGKQATPRDLGSAITYAKRYQLCGMLGISADVDDDAAVASDMREFGNILNENQLNLILKLFRQKEIDKQKFAEMIRDIAGVNKSYKALNSEEGDSLIKELDNLPDKKLNDQKVAS